MTETNREWQNEVVLKDLGNFKQIYLVPLADLHEGCRDADHEISDGYIKWIKDTPNAFTILNGDLLNSATKDSTPELYEDLVTPDMAYTALRKRLEPIADRVLMITRGGHEEKIFRKSGIDLMARLAYDLGNLPYKPDGGMLGIRLTAEAGTGNAKKPHGVVFWVYATHGWGSGRSAGSKVNKIEQLASNLDVDVVVLSHDHTQNIHRINALTPPGSMKWGRPAYMTTQRKLLINTGGFVHYSGYIQRSGYVPQDIGTPRILMEVKSKKENGSHIYYKDLHASI